MFVIRNKKTQALMQPGDKKLFIVYMDESSASTALQAYRGVNKYTKNLEFEIVPVRVIEKKHEG